MWRQRRLATSCSRQESTRLFRRYGSDSQALRESRPTQQSLDVAPRDGPCSGPVGGRDYHCGVVAFALIAPSCRINYDYRNQATKCQRRADDQSTSSTTPCHSELRAGQRACDGYDAAHRERSPRCYRQRRDDYGHWAVDGGGHVEATNAGRAAVLHRRLRAARCHPASLREEDREDPCR